jgi:large subunit ribosomal protein L15
MKLHELKADPGARKRKRRVGRGISAGQGKTAGRGTKGQNSRPGGTKEPFFEGGQNPLVRRMPFKRGFTNLFKIYYQEVSVGVLAEVFKAGSVVDPKAMAEAGLIDSLETPVVILGGGELKSALKVSAHRFSGSAKTKIEEAGGQTTKLELALRGAAATIKKLPKEKRPAVK